MLPAEPLRIVLRGDDADCAVVAMALFTGQPYADVLRAVLQHDPDGAAGGLTRHVIRRSLETLGMRVRFTKHVDWDDAYGILYLDDHATVLKRGQIVDTRSTWCAVWDWDDYLKERGYRLSRVKGIFLCRE